MEINNEDWEVVNDDGFVYRRLKRPRLDSTAAAPPPDLAAEEKTRRERKKKLLLKLKAKNEQEIHHWEHLSNTFKALQDRTQNQQPPTVPQVSDQTASVLQENSTDSTYQQLTDSLLAQVEAQAAAISEASRLCDVVEALCDAEEQRLRQPLIDLPIWEPSPKEIIASLLEK